MLPQSVDIPLPDRFASIFCHVVPKMRTRLIVDFNSNMMEGLFNVVGGGVFYTFCMLTAFAISERMHWPYPISKIGRCCLGDRFLVTRHTLIYVDLPNDKVDPSAERAKMEQIRQQNIKDFKRNHQNMLLTNIPPPN